MSHQFHASALGITSDVSRPTILETRDSLPSLMLPHFSFLQSDLQKFEAPWLSEDCKANGDSSF